MVHHDAVLLEAVAKTRGGPLFDNLSDPAASFIWQVLRDCRAATGGPPAQAQVQAEVEDRMGTLLGFEESFKEQVRSILGHVYSIPRDQTNVEMGRYLLQGALADTLSVSWADRARQLHTAEDLRKYVTEVSGEISSLNTSADALVKPFRSLDKYLVYKPRHPFGIRVLDLITGGGIAPGETLGLLGPTGGGKTVLAVGMLCERVLRKQHAMLVSYEQPVEGDIAERLCAYMLNEDVARFRDKSLKDVDPAVAARLGKVQAEFSDYVTVLDLSGGGRGAAGACEVTAHIDRQIAAGETPVLVIVDWLGSMVLRYLAANGLDSNQYMHVAQQFVDELNSHSKKHQYSLVINHQLRTDAARASAQSKPNVTDAYQFRSFSFFLDGCVVLGRLDPESNVGWLIMDKFRRGAVGDLLVKLDGAHVRFEPATGYVTDHRGRFIEEDAPSPDIDEELAVSEDYKEAFKVE